MECMSTPWIQKQNHADKNDKNKDKIEFELIEPELFKRPDVITKTFLNIVTILGLARTGKSTLMNSINEKEVFETSDKLKGCTEGVRVSDTVEEIDGCAGVAIFVDTEGQGNESTGNDYELLMPVLLLSKVIIFNIKGRIAVRDVLEELALLVKLGDKIKAKRGKEKFGHLIIAVRDYHFKYSDKELYDHFFKDELGNSENVNMRNKIRKQILERFGQPKVISFPNKEDASKVSEFQEKVEELNEAIHENIASPHHFHDSTCVTPKNVNGYMREMMVQAKSGCLDVDSIVECMETKQIDDVRSRIEKDFFKQCDDIIVTMFRKELREKLDAIKNSLLENMKTETIDVIFKRGYRDKVLEKLKNFFEERIVVKKKEKKDECCKYENQVRRGEIISSGRLLSGAVLGISACVANHIGTIGAAQPIAMLASSCVGGICGVGLVIVVGGLIYSMWPDRIEL